MIGETTIAGKQACRQPQPPASREAGSLQTRLGSQPLVQKLDQLLCLHLGWMVSASGLQMRAQWARPGPRCDRQLALGRAGAQGFEAENPLLPGCAPASAQAQHWTASLQEDHDLVPEPHQPAAAPAAAAAVGLAGAAVVWLLLWLQKHQGSPPRQGLPHLLWQSWLHQACRRRY